MRVWQVVAVGILAWVSWPDLSEPPEWQDVPTDWAAQAAYLANQLVVTECGNQTLNLHVPDLPQPQVNGTYSAFIGDDWYPLLDLALVPGCIGVANAPRAQAWIDSDVLPGECPARVGAIRFEHNSTGDIFLKVRPMCGGVA